MGKASSISKFIIFGAVIVGAMALVLFIVGVSTKNWIIVPSSSSSLEAKLNSSLENASFISSLLAATGATQTQIITIISATVGKVKEDLNRGVGETTWHLFDKTPNSLPAPPSFKFPRRLVLVGLVLVFVGALLAIVIELLCLRRVLLAILLLFLIVGLILITIGFIFYTKLVIGGFGGVFKTSVVVAYSLILVIIALIAGYIVVLWLAVTILYPVRNSQTLYSAVKVGR